MFDARDIYNQIKRVALPDVTHFRGGSLQELKTLSKYCNSASISCGPLTVCAISS